MTAMSTMTPGQLRIRARICFGAATIDMEQARRFQQGRRTLAMRHAVFGARHKVRLGRRYLQAASEASR